MAADHVIESVGGLHADGLQIGNDVLRAESRVARFHQNRCAVGTFDKDGAAPADVDVVNLELLGGEREREGEYDHCEDKACASQGTSVSFFVRCVTGESFYIL